MVVGEPIVSSPMIISGDNFCSSLRFVAQEEVSSQSGKKTILLPFFGLFGMII